MTPEQHIALVERVTEACVRLEAVADRLEAGEKRMDGLDERIKPLERLHLKVVGAAIVVSALLRWL